jgi:hypothetical protein
MYKVYYTADSIFFARWPEVRAVFSCDDIVDNVPRMTEVAAVICYSSSLFCILQFVPLFIPAIWVEAGFFRNSLNRPFAVICSTAPFFLTLFLYFPCPLPVEARTAETGRIIPKTFLIFFNCIV